MLEAIGVGETGWIAGLANALPRELVELFNTGINGESDKRSTRIAGSCHCSRMDTVPTSSNSSNWCRRRSAGIPACGPQRLELVGSELEQTEKIICDVRRSRLVSTDALPIGSELC